MFAIFSEAKTTLTLKSAALTDRGQKRKMNEDTVFHRTGSTRTGHYGGLYIVCDGLGGHQAGDEASRLAVETVSVELTPLIFSPNEDNGHQQPLSTSDMHERIQAAVVKAHAQIKWYVRSHPNISTMGTTITLVLVDNNTAYIANVGDSRTYIYCKGYMTQITEDHSWAAALARMGKIDEEEVVDHPRSNLLYRSLGTENDTDFAVDVFNWDLQSGDKILLSSDGLWRAFPDTAELAEWLDSSGSPADIVEQLVNEAKVRDGSDNISAVLVSVEGTHRSDSLGRSIFNKLRQLEFVK
jgi:serine/threonine protein phosphatase PrpC